MKRSTGQKSRILAIPALVALVLTTVLTGLAGAQTVLDEGSSSDLVAPPSPSCSDDAIVLIEEVEFTESGMPADPTVAPRLGVSEALVTSFDIEDFDGVDAGVVEVTEIITFDAHTGRSLWPAQDNERVALEFLLDGEVEAITDFTPDIEDGVNSAWVVSNLGEYSLPNGADAVRVVHFNEENNNDSLVVSALCIEFTEGDVDADDEEEESLTLAELIERAQENNGEGPDGDELALTGANEVAFGVIALGIILFGVAFKVQSQDPDDLRY